MVELYTEDDLEGCMTPKMHYCNKPCSSSDVCRRHVKHNPDILAMLKDGCVDFTFVDCNAITKPAYYPVPKVKP